MRLRSALFSVLVCVFLCGPALLFGALRLGADVPVQLTAEPAQFLAGGISSSSIDEHLNFNDFTNGTLQGSIEDAIGNYIPGKAFAIETNAAAQRAAIVSSNTLFAWDCYPTYFGSTRLAFPQLSVVTYFPQKRNTSVESSWKAFAAGVVRVAERHPDKRFVLYVVGGYQEPSFDPAYNLVSFPLRPSDCVDTLKSAIGDTSNVKVLSLSYEDADEYYRDFFRTDHHWNINGAFRAYKIIANELGLQTVEAGGTWEIPDYWFTGATARWGVDLLRERVFDCNNDFAELVAKRADGTELRGNDHSYFWDAPTLGKPYRFYDAYYGNLGECTIIGGSGDRAALLVGNSYVGAIQRPLASSYQSLTVNSQLHPAASVVSTLEQQMLTAGADDVIFVANPSAYSVEEEYWD